MTDKGRLLVTGCAGMLGSSLCRVMADDWQVVGLHHVDPPPAWVAESYQADVTDEYQVRRILGRVNPDLIIHCAGLINVDSAEDDFMATRDVNAVGTRNLVRHAPTESTFVYISTDAVFGGERGMYVETDLPCPLNNYSKSKLEGEWFVQQEAKNHLVLRTNFFGRHANGKSSFAEWIVGSLSQRTPIRMVVDWYFTPVWVEHLAEMIRGLIEAKARGLYHLAGGGRCSKHEFGVELARVFGFDESLITPVRFDQMAFKARRPQDMSLDCTKAREVLGKVHDFREGLRGLAASFAQDPIEGSTRAEAGTSSPGGEGDGGRQL